MVNAMTIAIAMCLYGSSHWGLRQRFFAVTSCAGLTHTFADICSVNNYRWLEQFFEKRCFAGK
jgi:hypothetical protein